MITLLQVPGSQDIGAALAQTSGPIYTYLYLIATVLFILGIKRLGKIRTARSGNQFAAVAMLLAIVTAILETGQVSWPLIITGLVVGMQVRRARAISQYCTKQLP